MRGGEFPSKTEKINSHRIEEMFLSFSAALALFLISWFMLMKIFLKESMRETAQLLGGERKVYVRGKMEREEW